MLIFFSHRDRLRILTICNHNRYFQILTYNFTFNSEKKSRKPHYKSMVFLILTNTNFLKSCVIYNFISFLLWERIESATQINWIGHVKNKPKPNVTIPITKFTTIIKSPPQTVAYSIPIGPNKKVSSNPIPTLLGERVTMTWTPAPAPWYWLRR